MASRIMDAVQEFGKKRKTVRVTIFPNAGGTPTWRSCGGVTSVVRTSQGLFTVTLDDPYFKVIGHVVSVQSVTAAARYGQLGTITNAGTSTPLVFQVRVVDGSGAVQDMAADANTSVHAALEFEDSSALSTDH